ncbi:hypothetical protein IOD16_09155 [Saccharothrix sp. 6-C]|uniref:Uncharacterized protein n=1 Tax=Saccharothrix texasensis TaxID=103734 RepID=A0A3N1H2K9_9PSEU|nr:MULTISPECIES: hypothetical protein [Saccharothrix]QQQ78597.1 hypothetical protein IOD16_09155 [Saccharothrix sp. 6-C]ROP36720.1 hypothetical protein EDD40_1997 [Saccharothrix texasensis]
MKTGIRLAVVATAAFGLCSSGVAVAQDTSYAPMTISPDQVKQLCEKRAPRIEERVTRLTTRINAGPEVPGSTAWLRAQAQQARDAGRTARAERLEQRLQRREGQLTKLGDAQRRVDKFQADHCGVK